MRTLRTWIWIAAIVVLGACGTHNTNRDSDPCNGIGYIVYGQSDTISISILYLLSDNNVRVVDRLNGDTTLVSVDLKQDKHLEYDIRSFEPLDTLVEVFRPDSTTKSYQHCFTWTGNDIIEMYRKEVK